jgi:hypothetical protein
MIYVRISIKGELQAEGYQLIQAEPYTELAGYKDLEGNDLILPIGLEYEVMVLDSNAPIPPWGE